MLKVIANKVVVPLLNLANVDKSGMEMYGCSWDGISIKGKPTNTSNSRPLPPSTPHNTARNNPSA